MQLFSEGKYTLNKVAKINYLILHTLLTF